MEPLLFALKQGSRAEPCLRLVLLREVYPRYVGIYALVPVEKAHNVNDIAPLEGANGGIDLGIGAGEVCFNAEIVGSAVKAEGDIDVVARLVVFVGDLFNGKPLEGDELVLEVNEVILTEQICCVNGGGNIAAILDLEGGVDYLDLAGPFGLVAGNLELCSGNQLFIVLLGAGGFVNEVCAVTILSVESSLVLPLGLLGLNVGLNDYLSVHIGSHVFGVGHHALGFYILLKDFYLGGLGLGGFGSGFGLGSLLCAAGKGQRHADEEQRCYELFHCFFSFYFAAPFGSGFITPLIIQQNDAYIKRLCGAFLLRCIYSMLQ